MCQLPLLASGLAGDTIINSGFTDQLSHKARFAAGSGSGKSARTLGRAALAEALTQLRGHTRDFVLGLPESALLPPLHRGINPPLWECAHVGWFAEWWCVRGAYNTAEGETKALALSGMVRSFGGIRAVDGVTFDVAPREIVGIIGPNGAGKTTFFDLISGFTPTDAGRVLLRGEDISSATPFHRAAAGLGRSFQDARLFPEITVNETLAVATERFIGSRSIIAAAMRLPQFFDSEQQVALRVDELLELMGLGQFRNSFIRELSTGTRRVVDLACQVAHRPTVILLDEPSSGIAQREVEALAPVLLRLRDEMGASLVVIEHDMPLISSISDRLVALDQGRVLTSGTAREVLEHPDVVESYLGTSSAAIARSGMDTARGRADR